MSCFAAVGRVSPVLLAGHNKWSKICHSKAILDRKKGVTFCLIANEIISAVKANGSDPTANLRLFAVLERAKKLEIPKKTIEAAIQKASGKGNEGKTEVWFGAHGPADSSILVRAFTDNNARTSKALRHIFIKHSFSMSDAMFKFEKKGVVEIEIVAAANRDVDAEMAELDAIEAGCLEFRKEGQSTLEVEEYNIRGDIRDNQERDKEGRIKKIYQLVTDPDQVGNVKDYMKAKGYTITKAEIVYEPFEKVILEKEGMEDLMEEIINNEDVHQIYTNYSS
jgi:transcriptional/translational regulatory protein YebC/TACO1